MEIRNHTTNMVMHERLVKALEATRRARGFSAEAVIQKKVDLLNAYYRQSGLKSAVVAISGGIDSAVVLGLVAHAQQQPGSPIERIVAVTMPDRLNEGVTGQMEAARLAETVCKAFGVPAVTIDISKISYQIAGEVISAIGRPAKEKELWCRGQVTSYARTPTYYFITSVLAAQGQPGLVIGTTNLSEGGYLGYFGKASDGMVDLQLISDLYKSEVYKLGAALGVPHEVMERAPTGDMFDATTDEVVFGAPYDFVELFMEYNRATVRQDRNGDVDGVCYNVMANLTLGDGVAEAQSQWDEYSANLNRMHSYNAHKYLGRSPAVHLDVLECGVNGGWDNPAWKAAG